MHALKVRQMPTQRRVHGKSQGHREPAVIDAVVTTEVVQYDRYRVTDCPLHGWSRDGRFPEGVNGPVQYGASLQALVVALNTVGAVSIARTHEILANVFDVPFQQPR